jgi:hypothetical protein
METGAPATAATIRGDAMQEFQEIAPSSVTGKQERKGKSDIAPHSSKSDMNACGQGAREGAGCMGIGAPRPAAPIRGDALQEFQAFIPCSIPGQQGWRGKSDIAPHSSKSDMNACGKCAREGAGCMRIGAPATAATIRGDALQEFQAVYPSLVTGQQGWRGKSDFAPHSSKSDMYACAKCARERRVAWGPGPLPPLLPSGVMLCRNFKPSSLARFLGSRDGEGKVTLPPIPASLT